MNGYLLLSDGSKWHGTLFGACESTDGEVVFNTGMTGYEQSMTDPSYAGQILTFTYPLIGNYGVPEEEFDEYGISKYFESEKVHLCGVVVSELSENFSHYQGERSLHDFLAEQGITGITGIDTRALTEHLREQGVMLGQIVAEDQEPKENIEDPNERNLVAEVCCAEPITYAPKNYSKTIALIDAGVKNNILRHFLRRGIRVIRCPYDYDISQLSEKIDGLFLSNGPGNPEAALPGMQQSLDVAMKQNLPIFGICLGNQILSLSFGAKTYKLKYGHRGVNQPCQDMETKKAIITSQNHGFVVDGETLPPEYKVWFRNLNDGTVEGVQHKNKPIFSVQFHPEACPGPEDSEYLFDRFVKEL